MKREDIVNILYKIKFSCDDFATMQTSFLCEFDSSEYEIKIEKHGGRIVNFHLADISETKKTQEKYMEDLGAINEGN